MHKAVINIENSTSDGHIGHQINARDSVQFTMVCCVLQQSDARAGSEACPYRQSGRRWGHAFDGKRGGTGEKSVEL